jgi:ABC-2 type transport system permease protein
MIGFATQSQLTLNKIWAFAIRGFLNARSYRLNFFGTYLGGVLYVFFYALLARFIGQQPAAVREYGDYLTFLLIGGVFSRYLSLGMKFFSRELEQEMVMGTVEPLMVTATSPALSLLGASAWILVEGILVLLLQLVVGALFFNADFSRANWLSAVVITALTLLALNSWGILSAGFVLVFKRADPLNWLVDLTTFIFSGVYFPISLLPIWLRVFSYLLPLTYALEGLRGAMMRGQALYEMREQVLALVVFNVLLIPLGLVVFRYALAYTKRNGSLGQY